MNIMGYNDLRLIIIRVFHSMLWTSLRGYGFYQHLQYSISLMLTRTNYNVFLILSSFLLVNVAIVMVSKSISKVFTMKMPQYFVWSRLPFGITLSGPRPTNDISIEFKIRPNVKICVTDHKEILHTSRQLRCRDVCKILLWSVERILNQRTVITTETESLESDKLTNKNV